MQCIVAIYEWIAKWRRKRKFHAYMKALISGKMTRNEVRAAYGLCPLEEVNDD